jgi:hypothetical protein
MNCDEIGLKLKFNHDDQKPKHELCKRKVETKSYFNNIWQHKYEIKETIIWYKIIR